MAHAAAFEVDVGAGGSVIIEFWLRGTPTTSGTPFEIRLWAVFTFDDDDLMTSERVFTARPTVDQIEGRVTTDGKPVRVAT